MGLGLAEVQISSYSYENNINGSKILLMDSLSLIDFTPIFNKALLCMDPTAKRMITTFNNISYSIDTFYFENSTQSISFNGTVLYRVKHKRIQ